MDTIAAPVSITDVTYLDIQITLIVVASTFVAVRVWTNWRYTSKVRADDCEDDPSLGFPPKSPARTAI